MTTAQAPAPGWYDDGVTADVERWFDGHDWTEHTRPLPESALRPRPTAVGASAGSGGSATATAGGSAGGGSWAPAATSPWLPGEPIPGLEPVDAPALTSTAGGVASPWGGGDLPRLGSAAVFGGTGLPAAAWAPTGDPAHWGWRVLASTLDQLFVIPPYLVGLLYMQSTTTFGVDVTGRPTTVPTETGVTAFGVGALITLVLWFVNRIALQGRTGQSWGKRIVGLRLVHEDTDEPLGMWWAFVRDMAQFVNSVPLYLGWLWPLWDARRQTFTDKLSHALVLRDPR
ncbi:RDD family protein [Cellulomonas sp. S1-8]|uniref:RDD family protein n=1 Tax=Cellulomonas sp. S1-8 TaxID=2904790 RepID=UPI00224388ED|nr:RDD family protein [Cellulomonas sp. S1-8]UZN03014.1 RDD family protein [Cellulomonas sp. S1-8]